MPCSTALAVAVLQVACKALQLAPQGLSICFTVPLITTIYLLLQHTNRAAIYQVYTGHEIIEHRCAENWKGRKELFVKSPDFYKYTNFPGGNLVSTTCCMQAAMYPWDIGDLSPFMLATKNLFWVLLRLDVQSQAHTAPVNAGQWMFAGGGSALPGAQQDEPQWMCGDQDQQHGTVKVSAPRNCLSKNHFQICLKLFRKCLMFHVKPVTEIQSLVFPVSPLNNSHTPHSSRDTEEAQNPRQAKTKQKQNANKDPPIPQSSVLRTRLTCVTSPIDSWKTISMLQIKHRHRCCSWKCLFVEQITYNRQWHLCQFKEAPGEDNGCFIVWAAVGLKVSSPWADWWLCSPGEAQGSHSLPAPCLEDA